MCVWIDTYLYSHHQAVFRFGFLVRFVFHFYPFGVCFYCMHFVSDDFVNAPKHINHADIHCYRKAFNILLKRWQTRENGAERKKLVYTHWHSPEWAGERTKRSEENILYFLLLSAFHWSKTVNFVRQKPRVEQSEIPFEKVAKSHESVWKSRKTVWKKSEPSYLSWYIKDDEARQRCKCKMFYYDGPYAICTTT